MEEEGEEREEGIEKGEIRKERRVEGLEYGGQEKIEWGGESTIC